GSGGRWPACASVKRKMFVDECDEEHSGDSEPMKGGHGDNYYYQLASCVRRYKGARAAPVASPAKTIDIDGDFAQWKDVGPEFVDDANDTVHRHHAGFGTVGRYTNATGRNDLVLMKVARDEANIYFYART